MIRAAKESLNGIDLWDVKRSYRFEQGFTFELNLSGVSDELRDAFVERRDADTRSRQRSSRDKTGATWPTSASPRKTSSPSCATA